jgi:hypothetical protein
MRDWWFEQVAPYLPPFFLGTLLAAAFGAFAGALATSRRDNRRAVTAELNCINAALMLCFSICNAFIALKRQHVRPMAERYTSAREQYRRAKVLRRAEEAGNRIQADFQTLPVIRLPIETAERFIFEKISVPGRALAAAVSLAGAIDALYTSIKHRNDLITEFHRASPVPHDTLAEKYFGIRSATGVIDENYSSAMDAIVHQIDDCIFFSRQLSDDLRDYGNKLRRQHLRRLRFGLPRIIGPADWSMAEAQGLIPAATQTQYADWLKSFKKRQALPVRVGIHIRDTVGGIRAWAQGRMTTLVANLRQRFRRRRLRNAWRQQGGGRAG